MLFYFVCFIILNIGHVCLITGYFTSKQCVHHHQVNVRACVLMQAILQLSSSCVLKQVKSTLVDKSTKTEVNDSEQRQVFTPYVASYTPSGSVEN